MAGFPIKSDCSPGEPSGLLLDALTTDTGAWVRCAAGQKAFQATVTGSGSVTATVVIEVSNDGVGALTLGTIVLSDTALATDGFLSSEPWTYARARVSAITGTSAAVDAVVSMGG
jgi:hypothetical protein